jgi:2-polyprenyl-3-methyl-5-hydroxy-6-metoxy-1,4-benzoquinol methylase
LILLVFEGNTRGCCRFCARERFWRSHWHPDGGSVRLHRVWGQFCNAVDDVNSANTLSQIPNALETRERARLSEGGSDDAIYAMVARELEARHRGGVIVDLGCGTGRLFSFVRRLCDRYVGVDVVRYDSFPTGAEFVEADLDPGSVPLPGASADVVVSVETIEHLENPRALMRELARLAAPGGWIAVTTPNQLSLLSKLSLVLKNQFPAFQEAPGLYPAHISSLLEIDLVRMARETGLEDVAIAYSSRGRIPGTAWHWPRCCRGRAFSDNVMMIARKPSAKVVPDVRRATFCERR